MSIEQWLAFSGAAMAGGCVPAAAAWRQARAKTTAEAQVRARDTDRAFLICYGYLAGLTVAALFGFTR